MASKQQKAREIPTLLQEIAEGFRETIFNQHNLLLITKKAVMDEDFPVTEALVISAYRFNDDLFHLYERLNDLAEADTAEGDAA